MRPKQVALVSILAVLLILVVYVLIAKPTLVLPSIKVAVPTAVLQNIAQQQNATGVDVRVRTDGKIIAAVGTKELGYAQYTPQTLGNTIRLAEKMMLSPSTSATIRLTPALIPGLRTLLLNAALTAYSVLPIEFNLQLTPG